MFENIVAFQLFQLHTFYLNKYYCLELFHKGIMLVSAGGAYLIRTYRDLDCGFLFSADLILEIWLNLQSFTALFFQHVHVSFMVIRRWRMVMVLLITFLQTILHLYLIVFLIAIVGKLPFFLEIYLADRCSI